MNISTYEELHIYKRNEWGPERWHSRRKGQPEQRPRVERTFRVENSSSWMEHRANTKNKAAPLALASD